ncbi:MAG: DIM/SIM/IMP family subclass B1 metallo-beta-lactamase [Alcanivoracaceae bacterium]|nr:DIM/SIM/IMP family subclass B1 metallo-beta-lactamase [Alcanivoracaceae bacterium]
MRAILAIYILLFICNVVADEKIPDLIIEEIQKDIYLHKSFSHVDGFGIVSANGLVVVENKKAFIIDTPWSEKDTAKLVQWIRNKDYELVGSISTHSHEDRTAGIKWLNARSILTYASALTNELLKKEGKELAKKSFEGTKFVLVAGLIEAYYPGGGHTIDNIVVWMPKSQILFGGCFVRSLGSKSLGYTGEAYIEKWPSSVEKVLLRYPDIKTVIPGHGKMGGVQLLMHTKQLAESASNNSILSTAKEQVD